jgi:hypothetical protein
MIDDGRGRMGGLWRNQKDMAICFLPFLKENIRKIFFFLTFLSAFIAHHADCGSIDDVYFE